MLLGLPHPRYGDEADFLDVPSALSVACAALGKDDAAATVVRRFDLEGTDVRWGKALRRRAQQPTEDKEALVGDHVDGSTRAPVLPERAGDEIEADDKKRNPKHREEYTSGLQRQTFPEDGKGGPGNAKQECWRARLDCEPS